MTHEMTIKAREVRKGQTVTRVVSRCKSRWLRRRISEGQQVERTGGQWPTVVEADYWKRGERGEPTVYLMLSDDLSGHYCLGPDDDVTVLTPALATVEAKTAMPFGSGR